MTPKKQYQKSSSLLSMQTAASVTPGSILTYTSESTTGVSIEAAPAEGSATILNQGLYLILFSASVNTGTSPGEIVTQLNKNGEPIPAAATVLTATADAVTEDISLATIVKVGPSCRVVDNSEKITVSNAGTVAGIYSNASLIIIKLA